MRTFDQKAYNQAYYLLHRDAIVKQNKLYADNNRELVRARSRRRAKITKEQNNLRARLWYQEHKQLMIDRAKEWKSKNKEKVQINTRAYASRKKYATGSYSTKDFIKLKNNLSGLCGYCGINKADTVDHIIPLSRGGSNNIGNIMPACGTCNYSKQCKTIIEWRYKIPVCTRNV